MIAQEGWAGTPHCSLMCGGLVASVVAAVGWSLDSSHPVICSP